MVYWFMFFTQDEVDYNISIKPLGQLSSFTLMTHTQPNMDTPADRKSATGTLLEMSVTKGFFFRGSEFPLRKRITALWCLIESLQDSSRLHLIPVVLDLNVQGFLQVPDQTFQTDTDSWGTQTLEGKVFFWNWVLGSSNLRNLKRFLVCWFSMTFLAELLAWFSDLKVTKIWSHIEGSGWKPFTDIYKSVCLECSRNEDKPKKDVWFCWARSFLRV